MVKVIVATVAHRVHRGARYLALEDGAQLGVVGLRSIRVSCDVDSAPRRCCVHSLLAATQSLGVNLSHLVVKATGVLLPTYHDVFRSVHSLDACDILADILLSFPLNVKLLRHILVEIASAYCP